MSYDIIVDGIPAQRLNLKSPHATIERTKVVSDVWTMFLIEPQPGMDSILLEIYDGTAFVDSAYRYVRRQLPLPEIYFYKKAHRSWPEYPLRWIYAEYPKSEYASCGYNIKSFKADLFLNGKLVYTMHSDNKYFDNGINQKLCTMWIKDNVRLVLRSIIVEDSAGNIYTIPEVNHRIAFNLPIH